MQQAIIISLITSITGVVVALINNKAILQGSRDRKMYAAKQSILQMILEDEISVELMGKIPDNHARIVYEYDIYKKSGGNSDIDSKYKAYEEWYSSLEVK